MVKIDVRSIIILVLIAIIVLMRKCNNVDPIIETRVETETVIEYDTVHIERTEYVPKYYETIVTVTDTVPASVDTLSILKDYYTKISYQDTIALDTLGYIVLNDTITQNRIYSRAIDPSIQIPIITNTIKETIYINNRELYAGPVVNFNSNGVNFVGGSLLLKDKLGHNFYSSIGFDRDFNVTYQVGVNWKLQKNKD